MRLFSDIQNAVRSDSEAVVCADVACGSEAIRRDAQGVPTAFRVLKPGNVALTIDGKPVDGSVDAGDIRSIVDWFTMKGEMVPLDCEHFLKAIADHAGVEEDTALKTFPLLGEKAVAGGVSLKDENGELWAHVEKLAGRARTLLSGASDKLYMYFSPVLRGIKTGPLRISSISLTNNPALNQQDILAAHDILTADTRAELNLFLKGQQQHVGGKTEMKDKIRKLCEAMKLDVAAFSADGADLGPLLTAVATALQEKGAREMKLLVDLKDVVGLTESDTLDTLAGKLLPLIEKGKADATALADLQPRVTVMEKKEHGRLVLSLKAEGKLTEAMLPWAEKQTSLALTEWAKTAPVVVPQSRIVRPEDAPADQLTLSDNAAAIARKCGLDPAVVAKTNGLKAVAVAIMFALLGCFGSTGQAAALTDNRNTIEIHGKSIALTQGSNVVFAGSMVALTNGAAVPAGDNGSQKVVGMAITKSDNTGENYSATKTLTVRRGVFRWENGGSFTAADIGSLAYVQDDATVTTAAAATADIVAGIIVDVDASGVWVDSYAVGGQGAASVTTLASSGNASVGGTLGVAGNSSLSGTLLVSGATTLSSTLGATNAGVSGRTLGLYTNATTVAGYFTQISTQLVYIAGAATNVVDADLTTP